MQALRFPQDLLKFLYWVFFKPITLSRYIRRIDPSLNSDPNLWILWRHSKAHVELRPLIWLVVFHILISSVWLGLLMAGTADLTGFAVNWVDTAIGVAVGVAVGTMFGAVFGMAWGVAAGVAVSVAGGVILGVADSIVVGVAWVVAIGVVLGLAGGMVFSVVFGGAWGVADGVLAGVATGVAGGVAGGMAGGMAVGMAGGVAFGVAFGVSIIVGFLRLPLYVLHLLFMWGIARLEGKAVRLWRFSPVHWDELIWLPLPGLDRHIIGIWRQDPAAGLEAIAQVAGSFGQGWAAERAIVQLIGEDLQVAATLAEIAAMTEKMVWLPDESRSRFKSLLLGIEEISRYARAALEGETLYNRQEQLRQALGLTERMRTGLALAGGARLAAQWGPGLEGWERLFKDELKALDSREVIPNVYVGGSPLAATSKVFKGRADLFRALEAELATAAEVRPALLLFGARRTGKTSVIKQLPNRLGPQIVPVEVDLQSAATAESAVGLLKRVSEVIYKACEARHFDVATVPAESLEKDPYPVFQDWLEKVEAALGERWLLLAMDEYEALGGMLEQGRVDERVFQLLRGLVQHHRLVILFSGAHTLEDLPPLWSNYLVNVKVLKVNPLKESEARELVTKPIPEFNLEYETGAVDMILRATACQPYLIQVVCRELVNALNEESRLCAGVEDVQHALDCALTSATAYFNDLFKGNDSDDDQRAVMMALAGATDGAMSVEQLQHQTKLAEDRLQKALRRLTHREVLRASEGVYRFRAEMVGWWVREKGS